MMTTMARLHGWYRLWIVFTLGWGVIPVTIAYRTWANNFHVTVEDLLWPTFVFWFGPSLMVLALIYAVAWIRRGFER